MTCTTCSYNVYIYTVTSNCTRALVAVVYDAPELFPTQITRCWCDVGLQVKGVAVFSDGVLPVKESGRVEHMYMYSKR